MLDRQSGDVAGQGGHTGPADAENIGSSSCDLLTSLRDGTRQVHARLEAVPAMARLLAPNLTHTHYVAALRGFRAFHDGMRRGLAPYARRFLPFDVTRNPALDALDADLAWYQQAIPLDPSLVPMLPDIASALGALYVLEGSALGGRVIGRALTNSLGVSPGFGGTFFCGVTAEAARRRWTDFSALLTRAQAWLDDDGTARAVAAACMAFGCFERMAVADPALPGLAARAIS